MENVVAELWEAIAPGLLTIISSLITFALGYVSLYLPSFLREWYNTKLRNHLHNTALRAAQAALEGDWKHFDFDEKEQRQLVQWITAQVREGAGDAIAKWNPSDMKLQGIALNAIAEALRRRTGINVTDFMVGAGTKE